MVSICSCVCLGHAKISVAIRKPQRGHAQAEQEAREDVEEGDEKGRGRQWEKEKRKWRLWTEMPHPCEASLCPEHPRIEREKGGKDASYPTKAPPN